MVFSLQPANQIVFSKPVVSFQYVVKIIEAQFWASLFLVAFNAPKCGVFNFP